MSSELIPVAFLQSATVAGESLISPLAVSTASFGSEKRRLSSKASVVEYSSRLIVQHFVLLENYISQSLLDLSVKSLKHCRNILIKYILNTSKKVQTAHYKYYTYISHTVEARIIKILPLIRKKNPYLGKLLPRVPG